MRSMRSAFGAVLCAVIGCGGDSGKKADTAPDAAAEIAQETTEETHVPARGLQIPSAARSCELVVMQAGGGAVQVTYGAGVTGRTVVRGDRTAVAFIATGDAAIAGDAVQLGGSGLTLDRATCFDREGKTLAGQGPTIIEGGTP